MDLTDLNTIKVLLEKFGENAKKQFGQNFLLDKKVLKNLVNSAEINKEDIVIEVGPGLGTVTQELSKQAKEVFAFEIDENKLPILEETLKDHNNAVIINQDFLSVELEGFLESAKIKDYKFVSSLPYNISKKIIQILLESEIKPKVISVLIQKEVAEKYVPNKNKTFLSNYLELIGEGKIIKEFGPEAFYPQPKIDSAILQIKPLENTELNKDLIKFIKNGFNNPRKKLLNVIKNIYKDYNWQELFSILKINEDIRAEKLEIKDWTNLYNNYKK